jgi:hypothetical protein
MVPMAASSRLATSRLTSSNDRARPETSSSSDASLDRSAPSACSWAVTVASPVSAARRRSTAAASASSASASRLLAASIACCSVIAARYQPLSSAVRRQNSAWQQVLRKRALRYCAAWRQRPQRRGKEGSVHTRSQRFHSLTPLTRMLEARLGGRPRRHDWFHASTPYEDLYRHFGITAEAVAAVALEKVKTGGTAARKQ